MKAAYKKEIEKRLKERGFTIDAYTDWHHANDRKEARQWKDGSFLLVFTLWPRAKNKTDILLQVEIRIDDTHCDWLISEKMMELTDEVIEKQGYAWIDETIQELYKDAYDVLAVKTKIAADAAVMGIE